MGHRELKRVPIDFDWPLHKVWDGYICHEGGPCPEAGKTCFNGETAGAAWLGAIVRLLCVASWDAIGDRRQGGIWPHPYLTRYELAPTNGRGKVVPPSADLHDLVVKLCGRDLGGMHDSIDNWAVGRKVVEAAGLPDTWGTCPVCDGHADDPAKRAAAEAWELTHPPKGDGYQLWETCSEGSPISPVFATAEALADWCAENATVFGPEKTTRENWLRMFREDDGADCGSMFIVNPATGYSGALINEPGPEQP